MEDKLRARDENPDEAVEKVGGLLIIIVTKAAQDHAYVSQTFVETRPCDLMLEPWLQTHTVMSLQCAPAQPLIRHDGTCRLLQLGSSQCPSMLMWLTACPGASSQRSALSRCAPAESPRISGLADCVLSLQCAPGLEKPGGR